MTKQPEECSSIGDVRAEIDRIDRHIVALIDERAGYVKAAAKFKANAADARAAERFQAMLRQRRAWAEACDLDPDMIETMYRIWWTISSSKRWRTGSRSGRDGYLPRRDRPLGQII